MSDEPIKCRCCGRSLGELHALTCRVWQRKHVTAADVRA